MENIRSKGQKKKKEEKERQREREGERGRLPAYLSARGWIVHTVSEEPSEEELDDCDHIGHTFVEVSGRLSFRITLQSCRERRNEGK